MQEPPQPPPGWYPDPEAHAFQRYWDGTRWTEHRAPASPSEASPDDARRAEDSALKGVKGGIGDLILAALAPEEPVLQLWRTMGGGRLGLALAGDVLVATDRRLLVVKTPAASVSPNLHSFPYVEIQTVHVGKPGLLERLWALQFSTSGISVVEQPITSSATELAEWRSRPNLVSLKKKDALQAAAFVQGRVRSL